MKKVLTTINNIIPIVKYIAYITIGIIVVYFAIQILTSKPKLPIDIQNKLDSLELVTKKLEIQQHQYDSSVKVQQAILDQLDFQIDHVKEKTTIIKEYYHEQSKAADSYTPTQLDSFFAKRYGY
jgi:hypothetical protein